MVAGLLGIKRRFDPLELAYAALECFDGVPASASAIDEDLRRAVAAAAVATGRAQHHEYGGFGSRREAVAFWDDFSAAWPETAKLVTRALYRAQWA
jgi:hypothetical protein